MKDSTGKDWHVYEMNDCDLWLATSLEEAKSNMISEFGYDCTEDVSQLSESDLDRLQFCVDDERKQKISFRKELENRINNGPKV